METTARKTYLDAIRLTACFGVIYNHVMGPAAVGSGASSFAALFAYFLSKTAVPLFLMITGALLLPRVDSYRKSFARVMRIGLALVVFYTLNYAIYCLKNGAAFDAGTLALSIYRDRLGLANSYWYLYRYISLLIMMPILQRMISRLTRRDIGYLLLFSVGVCGVAVTARVFYPAIAANYFLAIPLFSVYIGMLALGYYIDRFLAPKRGYILAAGLGCVVCVAVAALSALYAQTLDAEKVQALDRCERASVMLAAGCGFYLIKCLDGRAPLSARTRNRISCVAKLTFTVYLVSEMLIDNLTIVRTWLRAQLPLYGADLAYALAVYIVGFGVAAVAVRIPLLKKLL